MDTSYREMPEEPSDSDERKKRQIGGITATQRLT
jgi:hypothetical protein